MNRIAFKVNATGAKNDYTMLRGKNVFEPT